MAQMLRTALVMRGHAATAIDQLHVHDARRDMSKPHTYCQRDSALGPACVPTHPWPAFPVWYPEGETAASGTSARILPRSVKYPPPIKRPYGVSSRTPRPRFARTTTNATAADSTADGICRKYPSRKRLTLYGIFQDAPTSICPHDRQRHRRGHDGRWGNKYPTPQKIDPIGYRARRPDLALLARPPTPPPRTRPLMGYFENIPQGKDPMGYLPGGPDLVLLGRPPTPPPRTRPPMGYVENIPTRKDSIGYCAGRPNLALLAQPPSPSPRTRRPMGEQISHPPKN
ncbi:hypothetical protein DFH07DRAFT_535128 [Mycena maculata]|uniref:Uncharacterized protein n=1 Tax=Mycena maculata TaxID=230809 RepID=A0AAD7K9V2_9AGAR|nr:hypothetical protein DFH07DRAFT_535128 [Mycena maculata]